MNTGALARRPRPRRATRRRIVAQVAEALAFAHEHNVIHRDVSPGNLIRRSDGAVKLADFGLACRAGERAPKFGGDVAGTYGYIAPEVLRGETVTSLSDPVLARGAGLPAAGRAAGTATRRDRR